MANFQHLCFTGGMGETDFRARKALADIANELERAGVLTACRELFTTVWSTNVARHEPEELGDTAMSLGLQTHQNFITRAERRFLHDEREPEEYHWLVDALTLTRSGNSFVMSLNGARISVMKVPYEQGRQLRPDQLGKWDGHGQLRSEMARRNSIALGNYRSGLPGDVPLFEDAKAEYGVVRDFVLILAGEPMSTLTATWLGVPVLGDDPLIAVQRLWWDNEDAVPATTSLAPADGASFDDRDVPPLTVTLKPREIRENES